MELKTHPQTKRIVSETERLWLREVEEADFEFLLRMFTNPEVMKHYGSIRTPEQTKAWIYFTRENYEKYGHGKWIVLRKSDGRPIGHCGLLHTTIDGVMEVELGYFLDQPFWGRGYATEMAKGVLKLAKERFGYRRIVSAISPKNEPSVAVALRVGMKKEKFGRAEVGTIAWDANVYAADLEVRPKNNAIP